MSDLNITWLGHASVMLEGHKTILLDPWIDGNPRCERSLGDFSKVDLICVTHGHDDHLGDSIALCKQTGATMICTPELAIYVGRHGIEYDKGSCPLNIGGTYRGDGVEINMVNALHTSEILGQEFRADGTVMPGAGSVGYVVRMGSGPGVYYAGDTGVFGDMALIRELYSPTVAMLPLGGKYTMGLREAAYAAKLLQPLALIPIHYDTFPNQAADLDEFTTQVSLSSPATEVVALRPGETYTIKG